ncbi:MAG TPA: hypothetical protein VF310_07290, partial [Vicinamibacteria bacterium]
ALLAFQKEVETVLTRSTALAEAKREAEKRKQDLRALAGPRDEDPARVNSVLSALATDLESADAAPTAAQREVLVKYGEGLARYEARWRKLGR